jgi:hypothetical protein
MRRSFWSMVMATAAGAALAHFFDPDNGHERRERLRRRLEDGAAELADAQDQLHNAVSTVTGAVAGNGATNGALTEERRTDPVRDALESAESMPNVGTPDIAGVTNPPIR